MNKLKISRKPIKVPFTLWLRTRLMIGLKPVYKKLGDFESLLLKNDIQQTDIKQPVYITGLARSGTTVISQMLGEHSNTAHHCYSDFPEIFFPYWKNWLKKRQVKFEPNIAERAHQDRLLVNNNSIEAFEEVLWMTHFKSIHQSGYCLQPPNQGMIQFISKYQKHVKKILLIHKKERYIAKANYNINRIELLLEQFPDAKFVVPVRHPINHVASLIKQQQLFTVNSTKKINKQLAASGHFEFGEIREAIVCQDKEITKAIINYWKNNLEIEGWSTYWHDVYQSVIKLKQKSEKLNQAIILIKYEDLCLHSIETIKNIFSHCQLELDSCPQILTQYDDQLTPPEYYSLPFSQSEKNAIMSITNRVANHFDYDVNNHL